MAADAINEISQEELNYRNMLATRTKHELLSNQFTNVKCPKCGEKPVISMTSRNERTIVACPCGYVVDVEINF
jgi:predicted RNA-binding Zn-ribbon protein involved in translation (DUF1610 family)